MKIFLNNTINPVPSYFYAGSRIGQSPKEDGTKLDKYSGTVLLTIL
jgi:hypothetical protein